MKMQSAYAKAGVDYSKIQPFKEAMQRVARQTACLPNARGVYVIDAPGAHGGVWEYCGTKPALFCQTTEGLGNKNWVAEWMYQHTGRSYYDWVGQCSVRMATNDVIAQGALPVIYTDEVAAGDSQWFADTLRANDFAVGVKLACQSAGMALVAGESPALKYLVNARPPVASAPSLSGTATGIIAPREQMITGEKLGEGDVIIGVESSGPHANGFSLMIEEALKLPLQFLTKLPSGQLLGEAMLKPTRCYTGLMATLLDAGLCIHALLPGTGDGVAKLAYDKRGYTYVVDYWPEVPEIFRFFYEKLERRKDIQDPLRECLKTFNWGVGYYIFAPKEEEASIRHLAEQVGYKTWRLGHVSSGKRGTLYKPQYHSPLFLPPPGED